MMLSIRLFHSEMMKDSMPAARVAAIAIGVAAPEAFAVGVVAIPVVIRIVRIKAPAVASILLAAIQAIAIALLAILAPVIRSTTNVPAPVAELCLRRRIKNSANAEQERQNERGSHESLLQSLPFHIPILPELLVEMR